MNVFMKIIKLFLKYWIKVLNPLPLLPIYINMRETKKKKKGGGGVRTHQWKYQTYQIHVVKVARDSFG